LLSSVILNAVPSGDLLAVNILLGGQSPIGTYASSRLREKMTVLRTKLIKPGYVFFSIADARLGSTEVLLLLKAL